MALRHWHPKHWLDAHWADRHWIDRVVVPPTPEQRPGTGGGPYLRPSWPDIFRRRRYVWISEGGLVGGGEADWQWTEPVERTEMLEIVGARIGGEAEWRWESPTRAWLKARQREEEELIALGEL